MRDPYPVVAVCLLVAVTAPAFGFGAWVAGGDGSDGPLGTALPPAMWWFGPAAAVLIAVAVAAVAMTFTGELPLEGWREFAALLAVPIGLLAVATFFALQGVEVVFEVGWRPAP